MKSKAFTLIELLTVIAIIGILAAILIPVVGKVRETARQAVCGSNIRQISVAILLFADDNNGVLPTTGSTAEGEQAATDWILWRGSNTDETKIRGSAIVRYMGDSFTPEIYRCPSDERLKEASLPAYPFTYTMNAVLDPRAPVTGGSLAAGRLAAIQNPSRIILLAEEDSPNDSSAWLNNQQDLLTQRHGGNRGHVSFVDGHVELVVPRFAQFRGHWDPFYQGPLTYRP